MQQLPAFYVEGIKNLPAILDAASQNRLALTAFTLLIGAGLIFYLMKSAPYTYRFLALLLFFGTALAAIGQNVGGFVAPDLIQVYSGYQPHVNHFMLGTRATIRGGSASNAGFATSKAGPGRAALWQTTPSCRLATTDDFVLYASRQQPCMSLYGYLFGPGETPAEESSFINVWQGLSDGVNRDLLFVNPAITPNTGYALIGFLQQ